MPISFRRTPGRYCLCACSESSEIHAASVSFSSEIVVNLTSARAWLLAHCTPALSMRRTLAWPGVGIGGGVSRRRRQHLRWQSHPWRPTGSGCSFRRRPPPPKSPEASAWPSTPLRAPQHHHRGLASTGRTPCRRLARGAPFRRNREAGLIPTRLACEWNQ